MTGSRACLRALYLAAAIAPFAIWAATPAQADETFTRITTIPIPGNPLTSFDISWVDPLREQYMLADRSNKSLDVISTDSNQVQFQVTGFVGFTGNNDTSGPDGVLTIFHREAWVGDGNSTVKVVDLNSRSITDTIATGGTKRADELCFDRRDNRIMIANDADTPPFVTFISTTSGHQVLGHITFANATNGLEQCQWSYKTGLIYFAVPELNGNAGHGEIAVIDPRSMSVVNTFPMDCEPAGLAIGPDDQALVGCNDTNGIRVINLRNGGVVKVFSGNGADEVWFNPGDNHYLAALSNNTGGPILSIMDSDPPVLDQNIPAGTGDHSVAADPETNHIYFPLRPIPTDAACLNGCIGVYAAPQDDHGRFRQAFGH
jgi:hypothetical protein